MALAALAVAVVLTTLAVEFVAQALLLGAGLGLVACPPRRAVPRLAAAVALGVGLAGLPIAIMLGVLRESVRGGGFDASVALGNEIHPATLLQVLVPGLFGTLSAPVEQWWGGRFFSKGFPYFLSLYLGPLALSLALAALPAVPKRLKWLLLGLGAAALWYSIGAWGGLASLVSSVPALRLVRFPSKAFLIPHIVVALLAGLGVERLRSGAGWLRFGAAAGVLGGGVLGLLALLMASAGAGLVPWEFAGVRASVLRECVSTAAVGLGGALLGVAVARRVLSLRGGLLALLALLVLDLARAGRGMNPQVDPVFFRPLPELAAERLGDLRGGRVFTYGLDYSDAFTSFLKRPVAGRGLWSFFLSRQVLAPYANMLDRVEAAEAKDLTSFVARPPELQPEDYDPARVGSILPRLRDAAVSRIVSLDRLDHADLRQRAAVPGGPAGMTIHVYELSEAWPRAYLACQSESEAAGLHSGMVEIAGERLSPCEAGRVRLLPANAQESRYEVESAREGFLVARDTWARGWTATVDGRTAPVIRANGKHRAVPIGAGRHQVLLAYRAPGLLTGLVVTLLSGVATILVLVSRPRSIP
jgi:hypothetical protein